VRTGARREIPAHFRNPFLSDEYLNGYGKFRTPIETGGVIEKKKRALIVTLSNLGRGSGELLGVIYDAWAMKRFLSAQGYEVVWLKDFTVLRERVYETVYETYEIEKRLYDGYIAKAEAHERELKNAKTEEDRELANANIAKFRKQAEIKLRGIKRAQDTVDRYENHQFPGMHGASRCYEPSNLDNADEFKYYASQENIKKYMQEIVRRTRKGDSTFFYYSGHGWRNPLKNTNNLHIPKQKKSTLEKVSTVLSVLFEDTSISDTYIHDEFVAKLPKGSQAVMMFDSCHSGRQANLRYRATVQEGHEGLMWKEHKKKRTWPKAHVISISGCDDKQESTDGKIGGYLTNAFLTATKWMNIERDHMGMKIKKEQDFDTYQERIRDLSIKDLLVEIRENVAKKTISVEKEIAENKGREFDVSKVTIQVPQIECSSDKMTMFGTFLDYQHDAEESEEQSEEQVAEVPSKSSRNDYVMCSCRKDGCGNVVAKCLNCTHGWALREPDFVFIEQGTFRTFRTWKDANAYYQKLSSERKNRARLLTHGLEFMIPASMAFGAHSANTLTLPIETEDKKILKLTGKNKTRSLKDQFKILTNHHRTMVVWGNRKFFQPLGDVLKEYIQAAEASGVMWV